MTKLIYLTNSYLQHLTAKVIEVTKKGNQTALVLDKTIFHPQGGGQPADAGIITTKSSTLKVSHVSYNNGRLLHLGKLTGTIKKNAKVTLQIDWPRRHYLMMIHTAGHILHEAAMEIIPECPAVDGAHGISNKNFLKFKGVIDQTLLHQIESKAQEIIRNHEPITTKSIKKTQMETQGIKLPPDLPKNKPLRVMQIGERPPIPDGGAHLKNTQEVGTIHLTDIEYHNGHSIIHYSIPRPNTSQFQTPAPTTLEKLSLNQLQTKTNQLLHRYKSEAKTFDQKHLHAKYLGRKGHINQLTKLIPQLPPKNRRKAGQLINLAKKQLQTKTSNLKPQTSNLPTTNWLDVTAPGNPIPQGHLHPISGAIDEVTRIFTSIGFTRVRYPEVDWDYYVFESLNMPPNHPARDEWETFFIDAKAHPKLGQLVLTTHTSNGQVREMERLKKPPIRMINIAKCYRRQQDVTHTAMFHQFEGLAIDQGISIQHLKGTIDYFAKHFYGPKAKSRIRPFHFQFTEPSFEVDFSCTICDGRGCKFCKSGWHEVGGAGMVHPNVLKAGGIDPNKYTGFAFGWGIERTYTLKPGLKLNDIRLLYSSNLDFLSQF